MTGNESPKKEIAMQKEFDRTYVHYIRYLIENEIEMVRRKFCPCVNFAVYFGIGELSNKNCHCTASFLDKFLAN